MKIPGYTIRRRLGAGGQALVYLAIQESLGRAVALKVLHPVHSDSPEFSTRFLNEARILANLGHSNVITIHDAGVEGEFHYLSMEVVEGGDLKQRIQHGLDVDTTLEYLITIADCLANAHHKKIVHRDIKPGNVLFRRDGTLLLTDFGIAKQLDAEGELTVSGTTIGSPSYLSPEQAQGRPLDGRADIYSLGAMAFEMLTGRKPFGGSSEIDTIFKHINAPVPMLPDSLRALQPLIDRSMAKSPDDRFGSAGILRDYLRALRKSLRTGAQAPDMKMAAPTACGAQEREHTTAMWLDVPGTPSARPSGGRRLATLFALAVMVLVGAWLSFTNEETDPIHAPAPSANAMATPSTPVAPARPSADLTATPSPRVVATPPPQAATTPSPGPSATPSPRPLPVAAPQAAAAPATPGAPAPRRSPEATPEASPAAADARATGTAGPEATASQARVSALLLRAEQSLNNLRLTRPESDNAYGYYQQVLERDPGNTAARKGLKKIARRYAALAQGALGRDRVSEASDFVRRGLAVDASNPELLALQTHLARGRAPPRDRPPVRTSAAAATEIEGETPAQLLNRIKGWFK